jgi:uncharacterized protein GlcG (DUF336 family)
VTAMTLATARTILDAAFAAALELGLKPLAVAVLDAGGHLVGCLKQDSPAILRTDIAIGKAYGALAVGQGTRWLNRNAAERPHFVAALSDLSGGRIVPVAGGVLVKTADGAVIGAVGVSGDTSENDERCAIAAIEVAGLVADPGA